MKSFGTICFGIAILILFVMAAWARPACQNFPDGSYKCYNSTSNYGGYRGRNNNNAALIY